jgi:hypothetical protein
MKFPCFFPVDREIAPGDRFRATASTTAIENVLSGLALRKSTGALLALPLHQGLLAEVQLAMGATNAASLAVSAGLEVAEHSGER